MKEKLLIIGASGHGKVCADIALEMGKWNEIVFLDDNPQIKLSMGIPVIGTTDDVFSLIDDYDIFVGIGNNTTRKNLQEMLETVGATIATLVHPNAVIGRDVNIGNGSVIMGGVVINCCTSIGNGCIINTGSSIDHDNIIEDYVHISPGVNLAGTVKIGMFTWLGIGSIVINNISITRNCNVGAGTVVIKDILEPGKYLGVPARRV